MTRRSRFIPERATLPVLSGVLMGFAHPPFHFLVTSFVALVPFIIWLESLPSSPAGRRQARAGGFLFGLVYFTLVLYWLLVALIFYTWMALLAFFGPILILSVFMSWMAVGIHTVRSRLGWPIAVVFPVFWTAIEVLRAHLLDISFPWMQLGDTLSNYPMLVGAADLVGSRGLSLWLAAANALIAVCLMTWRRKGWRAAVRPALGLLLAVALPVSYSLMRWHSIQLRPVARVGVVQPNVPQHLRNTDPVASADSARRATTTLIAEWPARERIDLALFPETMFQGRVFDPLPSLGYPGWEEARAWGAEMAAELGAEVAIGGIGADDRGDGTFQSFNSAYHFRPREGVVNRYDKRFLVPLVERVPFIPPEWLAGMPYMEGNFGVGGWQRPVEIGVAPATAGRAQPGASEVERKTAVYGTMICYESIFSPLARHYRRNGADFLVNLTNDSWFGRDVWWSRSSALWQHPAHLVMRAIETRMGAARAANTGISMIVDPLGRVVQRTDLFVSAAFTGDVATTDGMTVYVRTGDAAGTASALVAILALGASILWGRRERSGEDGSRQRRE